MLQNAARETATDDSRATSPVEVLWSHQFDMTSEFNGRTYRVFVFQPPIPPPPGGYPGADRARRQQAFPDRPRRWRRPMRFSTFPAVVVGVGCPTANPGRDDDLPHALAT